MSADNKNEVSLDLSDQKVEFKKISPKELANLWNEVMGGSTSVRREKFTKMGGDFVTTGDSVLEDSKILPLDDELSLLTWQEGELLKRLRVDDTFMVGVQDQENGGRSIVMSRLSVDSETGQEKQVVRRFTPIEKNSKDGIEFNKWEVKNPVEIAGIFEKIIPKGSTILMEKMRIENGEYVQENTPIVLNNFSFSLREADDFRFLGVDMIGNERSGHINDSKTVIVRNDDGISSVTLKESKTSEVPKLTRFTVAKK